VMLPSDAPVAASTPDATYPESVNATGAWGAGVTGEGVTIAVIDSGLAPGRNFTSRVAGSFEMSSVTNRAADENGHGTYVSGIIAGHSDDYSGIAPGARVLSLKVAGRNGAALASDVIGALQWAVDHKEEFGIRVVNLSLTSSVADSYRQDPLSAAAEQAWFHGIVVVTSAGNFGTEAFAADHAPANDPFVISVGAFGEAGTAAPFDDSPAAWSSRGVTVDGYAKPELMAPGVDIVSTLARGSFLARDAGSPGDGYVGLSGTSASAAIVSGTVALMLDAHPELTPDQVKFRLIATGGALDGSAAPRADAYAATFSDLAGSANAGATLNALIDPDTGDIAYNSVLWRSVLWRSVLWRSIESSVLWRG
jgi:serine protease AprX